MTAVMGYDEATAEYYAKVEQSVEKMGPDLDAMGREFIEAFPVKPDLYTNITVCIEELEECLRELKGFRRFYDEASGYNEYRNVAFKDKDIDWKAAFKEMSDCVVTFQNIAHLKGVSLNKVHRRVHKSNMSKFKGAQFREDGKLLKGPNYQPPNLDDLVV